MEQVQKFRNLPKENQIGFLAPLIAMLCIAIATSILPNFDWSSNPLSDLGSWFRTDLGNLQILSAILFNGGLIVTGLLMAYFTVWLIKQSNDLPTKIGLLLFVGTSLFLAGVGVFSEDFPKPHLWTALPFFFSIPIALGVVGLVWLRFSEMRVIGVVSILFSLLSILIIVQPWIDLSIAVFEIVEALVAMGWLWFINYMQYTGKLSRVLITNETI
ncbi:MAG: DUF998 domain-containing protein [Candidatus Thorarchaeota archaeon]